MIDWGCKSSSTYWFWNIFCIGILQNLKKKNKHTYIEQAKTQMPQKKQQKLSVSNVLLVDGLGYNDRCKLGNLVFNKTNEYINTYRNQLYQDR